MLRSAINLILDHVENDLGLKKVTIPSGKGVYWDMNIDHRFTVDRDAPELTVGSIKDDMEFLQRIVDRAEDSSTAPALMLMHVSPVLNFLCDVARA